MDERVGPDEPAAALRLDRAIDDALAGADPRGVDEPTARVIRRLAAAAEAEVPAVVAARAAAAVRRVHERPWRAARVAAAALAALLHFHGVGNLVGGRFVAEGLGAPYDPHVYFEGGVALAALGGVALAGALARRWLDLSVAAAAPVGLVLAVRGGPELAEFPAGGVLHLAEGVAAAALVVLWWRARRYVSRRSREQPA